MRCRRQLLAGAVAIVSICCVCRSQGHEPEATRPLGKFTVFSVPGRRGYIDTTGKFVLEGQGYKELNQFSEGLAAVRLPHDPSFKQKWTFINRAGKRIVTADLGFARDFSEGLAAVEIGGYRDPHDHGFSGLPPVADDRERVCYVTGGKWGYLDTTGEFVIKPRFALAFSFREGLARVSDGKDSGYISRTGKLVLRRSVHDCGDFSEGLARFRDKNEKYGFISRTGEVAIPPRFRSVMDFRQGRARVQTGDEKWGYVDRTGRMAIAPQFDRADDYHEGLAAVCKEGKWGYIDRNGKVLIGLRFGRVRSFRSCLAAVEVSGKWGYIDRTGHLVIQPQFLDAGPFRDGVAWVRVRGVPFRGRGYTVNRGAWRLISKSGTFVSPLEFDGPPDFHEGLAVAFIEPKYGLKDDQGWIVQPAQFDWIAQEFWDGFATVCRDGRRGFLDPSGRLVVPCQFERIRHFSEGRAAAQVGQRWGFIDRSRKLVVSAAFMKVDSFSEGLAAVCPGKVAQYKWGYIDKAGTVVIPPKFPSVGAFSEGLAAFLCGRWGLWGFIDRTGKVVIVPQFDGVEAFSEGRAALYSRRRSLWGFIDRTGKVVIAPQFKEVRAFSDGRAAVCGRDGDRDDVWGLVDRGGNVVAKPRFEEIEPFSEGLAVVRVDGRYGYIDKAGKMPIPARFRWAWHFAGGRATVTVKPGRSAKQRWGVINRSGQWILPAVFDYVRCYEDGTQIAELDHAWYQIDPEGNLRAEDGSKLGAIPQLLAPRFIKALENSDAEVRADAIRCLGRLGGPHAVAALVPLVTDRDWRVCMLASLALEEAGRGSAVERLVPLLKAGQRRQRLTAALALGAIVRDPRQAAKLLVVAEQMPQASRRALMGQAAMGFVAREDYRKLRRKLKTRIARLNLPDIGLCDVLGFLRDVTDLNIYTNWRALAKAGVTRSTEISLNLSDVTAKEALRAVCLFLTSRGQRVGYTVMDGVVVVSTLEDLYALAGVLLQQARRDKAARDAKPLPKPLQMKLTRAEFGDYELDDVIGFFRDVSGLKIDVRWDSLKKLGLDRRRSIRVCLRNLPLATALRFVLLDAGGSGVLDYTVEDGRIVISKAAGLKALSTRQTAVLALTAALKHDDREVRLTAAAGLGKIGPAAKAAIPGLTQALKDPAAEVRKAAAEAIKKIRPGR